MNLEQLRNDIYQEMIQNLRARKDLMGNSWPGKSGCAPAVTRYPNILAELCTDDFDPNIAYLANYAGVSKQIMAAVVEDNEELSAYEFYRLAQRWGRGPVEYLASPVLQIIDPLSNKGKVKQVILRDLLRKATGNADESVLSYSKRVLDDMNNGTVITYARWNDACRRVRAEMLRYSLVTSKRTVRTKRRRQEAAV